HTACGMNIRHLQESPRSSTAWQRTFADKFHWSVTDYRPTGAQAPQADVGHYFMDCCKSELARWVL
ncbi:MAG: hypothetical protein M3120_05290, partial [Pseudomonadota bacterium]|nr:hypothetical protein [Pseudomonadota bacterium]